MTFTFYTISNYTLCKTFKLFDSTLNLPQMVEVIPEETCRVH